MNNPILKRKRDQAFAKCKFRKGRPYAALTPIYALSTQSLYPGRTVEMSVGLLRVLAHVTLAPRLPPLAFWYSPKRTWFVFCVVL
jgi:hypothetical protein